MNCPKNLKIMVIDVEEIIVYKTIETSANCYQNNMMAYYFLAQVR